VEVVQNNDERSAQKICNIINRLIEGEYGRELLSQAKDLKESLVRFYGHVHLVRICNSDTINGDHIEKSLDELLEELNSLVGLEKVKSKVKDLIAYQRIQVLRKESGLTTPKSTLHLAFTGNPGTGKTTVARIVGRIYRQIGLLSKGHFIEVSRTDLIAGYQGQTALKVKDVIERAKGGVLFIDEAYSITENDHADSYGRECLTELTKALEDYRDDLVVIVAGYTEPMKKFFDSNPGLKSRFNTYIEFEDYNAENLLQILNSMCIKADYVLEPALALKIEEGISRILVQKDNLFSNGRYVRNLFESLVMNHARRVSTLNSPNLADLKTLNKDDIPDYL
jgi:SpoVK/Ycf46/Vps4 family AAA+-type ATPase